MDKDHQIIYLIKRKNLLISFELGQYSRIIIEDLFSRCKIVYIRIHPLSDQCLSV